jgi:maltose alpha-D-glucosyltransferase/alpha-amylase
LNTLAPDAQALAQQVLSLESGILQRFRRMYEARLDAVRIRIHGDYHLGQVLHTGKEFLILDFEGEPSRPLSERSLKRSPLADVAGMIRSFHYAAHAALLKQSEHGSLQPAQMEAVAAWAHFWSSWVSATFLRAWLDSSGPAPYLPKNEASLQIMLEAELFRKGVYELGYELNNRPDWVKIPLLGIAALMATEAKP